jgi:hypothetical protein
MGDVGMRENDKRAHARINIRLAGRCLLANRQEHGCTVIDGSPSGVALLSPERGRIGETVVVYVEQIGRVEGNIVRLTGSGFAIKFSGSRRAAEALVQLAVEQPQPTFSRVELGRSRRPAA